MNPTLERKTGTELFLFIYPWEFWNSETQKMFEFRIVTLKSRGKFGLKLL